MELVDHVTAYGAAKTNETSVLLSVETTTALAPTAFSREPQKFRVLDLITEKRDLQELELAQSLTNIDLEFKFLNKHDFALEQELSNTGGAAAAAERPEEETTATDYFKSDFKKSFYIQKPQQRKSTEILWNDLQKKITSANKTNFLHMRNYIKVSLQNLNWRIKLPPRTILWSNNPMMFDILGIKDSQRYQEEATKRTFVLNLSQTRYKEILGLSILPKLLKRKPLHWLIYMNKYLQHKNLDDWNKLWEGGGNVDLHFGLLSDMGEYQLKGFTLKPELAGFSTAYKIKSFLQDLFVDVFTTRKLPAELIKVSVTNDNKVMLVQNPLYATIRGGVKLKLKFNNVPPVMVKARYTDPFRFLEQDTGENAHYLIKLNEDGYISHSVFTVPEADTGTLSALERPKNPHYIVLLNPEYNYNTPSRVLNNLYSIIGLIDSASHIRTARPFVLSPDSKFRIALLSVRSQKFMVFEAFTRVTLCLQAVGQPHQL